MQQTIEINPDDKRYTRSTYEVAFHNAPTYIVHADDETEALDAVIDRWEENESQNPGYFMTAEDEAEEDYPEEYVSGGNHGRRTSFRWEEVHIKTLEKGR